MFLSLVKELERVLMGEHIAQNWRMNKRRYCLEGKASLSSDEVNFLVASGASLVQILELSREQLESRYPSLASEESFFAISQLAEYQAANK